MQTNVYAILQAINLKVVYPRGFQRCRIIKATAEEVFKVTGHNQLLDVALELERIALQDDYFVSRLHATFVQVAVLSASTVCGSRLGNHRLRGTDA